jgi:hypothetical protein
MTVAQGCRLSADRLLVLLSIMDDTFNKGLVRRPGVHVSTLVGTLLIIKKEITVKVELHFIDALVELGATDDPKELIKQSAV